MALHKAHQQGEMMLSDKHVHRSQSATGKYEQTATLTRDIVDCSETAVNAGVFLDGVENRLAPVAVDLIASHAVQDKQTLHGFRSQEAVASAWIHVRASGIVKPRNFRR
jgi:hypothetical protein